MEESYLLAFSSSPEVEWLAMLASIFYVYLAAKGNIWCWLAGFISCLLFTFVFLYQQVYTQIVLNILYMLMAIFGWIAWMEPKGENQASVYIVWSSRRHLIINSILLLCAYLMYLVVPEWFGQQSKYLEIVLVLGSVFATVTTIFRVVESWVYWVVLNLLGAINYWQETSVTLMFFLLNAILAVYGLVLWRSFRQKDISVLQVENQ